MYIFSSNPPAEEIHPPVFCITCVLFLTPFMFFHINICLNLLYTHLVCVILPLVHYCRIIYPSLWKYLSVVCFVEKFARLSAHGLYVVVLLIFTSGFVPFLIHIDSVPTGFNSQIVKYRSLASGLALQTMML